MIEGLIFDFDGLIIDTELCYCQSVQEMYREFRCEVPPQFFTSLGSSDLFDPYDYLAAQGHQFDREMLSGQRRRRHHQLVTAQPLLPGVMEYLQTSKRLGLKLGLASSSTREWVVSHLTRTGLLHFFDCIKTADDVQYTKPDPELFLAALSALRLPNSQAIVLEDSPNGILAAQGANIFSVAVPSQLTRQLSFHRAGLVLDSLSDISLEDLLAKVDARKEFG